MRTPAAAAIVGLLALSALAGCGDDDEGARAPVDHAAAADAGAQPDLEAAVAAAQLEADDLGVGWELTESKAPGEDDDDDEPNPVDDCMRGLDDRFDEAKVAESEERTFQREGNAPLPAEVVSSSVALDDGALFVEMHDLLRSPDFAACLHSGFEEAMASMGGEADVTVGDVAQSEGAIDPGADPQLTSTVLSIPITTGMDGLTLDLSARMVFLSTGQLGSSILVLAPEGEVPADDLAEWGGLLAERLAGA